MKHFLSRAAGAMLALFLFVSLAAPAAHGALFRPTVEKEPLPETVNEWESAVFVAHAAPCESRQWRIVSSDGSTLYDAAAAPDYFPGLRVEGADSDTLTLLDIPHALNGWLVECLFTDTNGEKALSVRALLTVRPVGPTASPEPTPTPNPSPTPTVSPSPETSFPPEMSAAPTEAPSPAPETPEPDVSSASAADVPLPRRAVLGVFAGVIALALVLGALSLKVRGGAHSTHRRR